MAAHFFFDSHGALWATCDPDFPTAQPFGPQWAAREARVVELNITPIPGETPFSSAQEHGCEIWEDDQGWTHVEPRP